MSSSSTVMARLRTMISVGPVLMKPPVVVLAAFGGGLLQLVKADAMWPAS
jgi:hypothetical protein